MNDAELLDRATKAKAILESQIYQESWEATRNAIIALIEKTPLSETSTAEDLRRCLKLLKDVRTNVEAVFAQGKVAEFRLSQQQQKATDERRGIIRGLFR